MGFSFISVLCISYALGLCLGKESAAEELGKESRRIKVNTIEKKYYKKFVPLLLQCFDPQNRPDDDDIISYEWRIGQYTFHHEEIDGDDYDYYIDGARHRGDIIMKDPQSLHQKLVQCRAAVVGDLRDGYGNISITKGREYQLIEAKLPNITLKINGSEMTEFRGKKSLANNITCEAKGGKPLTIINIFLDGKKLTSAQEPNVASVEVNFDHNDNGKVIQCEVESPFELFQPVTKNISLDITFIPRTDEDENTEYVSAIVGEPLTIPFKIKSNPAPWKPEISCSSSCSNFGEYSRLDRCNGFHLSNQTNPGQSSDEFSFFVSKNKVNEVDLHRCIFLRVSNTEGSTLFQKKIFPADGLSTGAIAGIVIGVMCFFALCAYILYKCIPSSSKLLKKSGVKNTLGNSTSSSHNSSPGNGGARREGVYYSAMPSNCSSVKSSPVAANGRISERKV